MKTKINIKDIQTSKIAGEYDYKLNDTYYQLSYDCNKYWVVYETKETIHGTPHDWMVVNTCSTFKEAKEILSNYINK